MIADLECVALTVPLPEHGLAVGDVGTVVHAYKSGAGYMVEFTTFDGTTVAVVRVAADGVRSLGRNEVHHSRTLDLASR